MKMRVLQSLLIVAFMATLTLPLIQGHARHGGRAVIKLKGRCIVAKAATAVLPGPKTKRECLTACRVIEAAKGCQYRKGNKMCKVVMEAFEKANFKLGNGSRRQGVTCWRFIGGPAPDEGIKGRCIVAKAAKTVLPGPKTKRECLAACRAIEGAKGCQYRNRNKMCKVVMESFEKANFKLGVTCWMFTGAPVDGGWGPWGAWGSCNSSTGMKKRNRQCDNPKPLYEGAQCAGNSQESEKCPVDGGWSPWGAWASCNSSTEMKKRNRQCDNPKPLNGGAKCAGNSQESEKCPVDGGWGPWGAWASCNSSTGMKKRNRQCNNPKPLNGGAQCAGNSQESEKCPVDGGWGPWGAWASCNSSTGMKKRNRQCDNPKPLKGGAPCAGKSQESEKCSDNTLIFLGPGRHSSGQSEVFDTAISENNNLTRATCTVPQYPITDIQYSMGFIYEDFLHICGGDGSSPSPGRQSACFSLINSTWSETTPMLTERFDAAAVRLHNGSVLVSGGLSGRSYISNSQLQTSELLTGSTWKPAIQLPSPRSGHCMLKLSSGEIFLHGGYSGTGSVVKDTHISKDHANWEEVMSSKNKWAYHTCTEVIINSDQQVLVGRGGSTEILQLLDGTWTWTDGPDLPNYCYAAKFVSYNGKMFYACGDDKNIYQLKDNWGTQQDAWTKIGEMSEKRNYFPALLITEDVCKGVKPTPPTTDTSTDTATPSTPAHNAASVPPE